ncbi:MAG: FKBP-type peptidyl-prolyl cis-trans isomerase [Cyclobacteriaceae bacterium]
MKKGEKARIIIPSELAYGPGIQVVPELLRSEFLKAAQLRDIKPLEPLIFEIEIVDIN